MVQFRCPSAATSAGASRPRTTTASSRMPSASVVARIFTSTDGTVESATNDSNRISAAEVTRRPVWRDAVDGGPVGVAVLVVALADPGQDEDLVVHRQAEQERERGDRHPRGDRPRSPPVPNSASDAVALLPDQHRHAVRRGDRDHVEQQCLDRQPQRPQRPGQQEERHHHDRPSTTQLRRRRRPSTKSASSAALPPTTSPRPTAARTRSSGRLARGARRVVGRARPARSAGPPRGPRLVARRRTTASDARRPGLPAGPPPRSRGREHLHRPQHAQPARRRRPVAVADRGRAVAARDRRTAPASPARIPNTGSASTSSDSGGQPATVSQRCRTTIRPMRRPGPARPDAGATARPLQPRPGRRSAARARRVTRPGHAHQRDQQAAEPDAAQERQRHQRPARAGRWPR